MLSEGKVTLRNNVFCSFFSINSILKLICVCHHLLWIIDHQGPRQIVSWLMLFNHNDYGFGVWKLWGPLCDSFYDSNSIWFFFYWMKIWCLDKESTIIHQYQISMKLLWRMTQMWSQGEGYNTKPTLIVNVITQHF